MISGYRRGMINPLRAWSRLLVLAVCGAVTGCTTPDKTAGQDKKEPAELTEAPLGSRIKRKTTVNPITTSTREQLEQQRAQQGAISNAMVNDPAKYSGRR